MITTLQFSFLEKSSATIHIICSDGQYVCESILTRTLRNNLHNLFALLTLGVAERKRACSHTIIESEVTGSVEAQIYRRLARANLSYEENKYSG